VKAYRAALGPVAVVLLFVAAALWSPFEPHRPPSDAIAMEPVSWSDEDWETLESTLRWAIGAGVDTLPLGERMAEIGLSFVGTAYVPGTLEVAGPERLVINFQGLDCVTFVENVFALSRIVRSDAPQRLDDRAYVQGAYERELTTLRYRDGVIAGYPSRLHYFTDWITANERGFRLKDVTETLGGVVDPEPIDFMTTHRDAYPQLVDPANVERIQIVERALSEWPRNVIPQSEIAAVSDRIKNGDIIAATSTVEGLDVAHTGLALWVGGTLRLMHAPLVGSAVEVSETTLAERVEGISGQDGIIVARPLGR